MAYVKSAPASHPEAALIEAAGLRWLAEAEPHGGAAVATVLEAAPGRLELEEVQTVSADRGAAARLGEALARTHRSLPEDTPFGSLPPEHPEGASALFGPADQPLAVGTGRHSTWGVFQASERLGPVLEMLRPSVAEGQWETLRAACRRIEAGAFDDDEPPSRLHGDLWSGNVLWRAGEHGVEAVLIDPAAHAGHRESDLAMLALFGLPHLDTVLEAYHRTAPLRPGWEDRMPAHQLFYLAVHWLLFGPGYQGATVAAAEQVLAHPAGEPRP